MARGSKGSRRMPAEGEAFFTSAMMPKPGPCSRAVRKERTGGADAKRISKSRAGNWSGTVVWFAALPLFLAPALAIDLFDSIGVYQAVFEDAPKKEDFLRMALWASPLTLLLFLANLYLILFTISRTRPSHLGFSL